MPAADERALSDVLALHPLLPLAWKSAVEAGEFLRLKRPKSLGLSTKSTPTDLVTAMDKDAEEMLIRSLLGDRPTDGLLGEEGGERLGTSGVRWVVDPLDGTVNYVFRLPMWGVSVAAEESGRATVGVVVTPEFEEGYIGVAGAGAWLVRGERAVRIQVSACSTLSTAMVATGFGYAADRRRVQARVVSDIIGEIRDIRRMGAAVVDFCWLARGRLDAYYERGLNAWDLAAGALIAAEAGAIVTGLRDDDYFGSMMVASAPGISGQLIGLLASVNADADD